MARLALLVTLCLHTALSAGDVAGTESGICFERCPDDDAQGNCAATCTDCTACPHAQPSAVTPSAKDAQAAADVRVPQAELRAPPAPEPAEILHVPKARLA